MFPALPRMVPACVDLVMGIMAPFKMSSGRSGGEFEKAKHWEVGKTKLTSSDFSRLIYRIIYIYTITHVTSELIALSMGMHTYIYIYNMYS